MEKEVVEINGEKVELVFFENPMLHEDWHKAEELELEYVYYAHHGPDYWDDKLVFCPKGRKQLVREWIESWDY